MDNIVATGRGKITTDLTIECALLNNAKLRLPDDELMKALETAIQDVLLETGKISVVRVGLDRYQRRFGVDDIGFIHDLPEERVSLSMTR